MTNLRELFLLDPDVVFLNHGSFGATPRPVFEAYQDWQRRLERQPVNFIATELSDHLRTSRQALADYLGVSAEDAVFVPNATTGVNIVARSLRLAPGDEVLASDHEYGACDKAWEFICRKTGAAYVRQPVPLPTSSPEEIVEHFWRGVTPRTRVIFLSHITAPTGLQMPVEVICQRAREAGILTLIDGAHAPGQIPLDLEAIGADFYTGNLHKWALGPKGSGFLHTRRDKQSRIEPLVVSWGWGDDSPFRSGSAYLDYFEWSGTADPSAYLATPAAIQFQADHDWPAVRRRCHELAQQAVHRICELTGLAPLYPDDAGLYHQMAVAPLPPVTDLTGFKSRLYAEYRVEIPCFQWKDRQLIRVSVQGYNTQADLDALLYALEALIPQAATVMDAR